MNWLLTIATVTLTTLPCLALQMAFTIQKSDFCSSELCVNGTFKKGQTVTVLSKESEKTCTATTGESFTAEDEVLKFSATKLENLKGCKSLEKPFLAVFAANLKYNILKGTALSADKLTEADSKVKASKAFNEIYERTPVYNYEVKKENPYPTYSLAELKKSKPSGIRYPLKDGKSLDIVWHIIGKDEKALGALFGVHLDKVSAASGLFNVSEPYVFLINDQVHVLSNKSCQLGCGENTNQVYELSNGTFIKTYSNSDFST